MEDLTSKILKAVSEMEAANPELAAELDELRHSEALQSEARKLAPNLPVSESVLEMEGGGPDIALETIVLRTGRPVLTVSNDSAILNFTDAQSLFWRDKLKAASSMLSSAIKAIGRIEVQNHPDYVWLGTGWMVDTNIVVTNRHVASLFAKKSGSKFIFRQGSGGQIKASIDFLEEFGRNNESVFKVTGILHIEDDNGPDIALLSVAAIAGRTLPKFISLLDSAPIKKQEVAVIGYPARDSRIPEPQLMKDVFGDIYDKKRLAPGQITGVNRDTLLHDCSTLGGNSGSAVIDLKTGKAVALHFAGRFLEANYAVPASLIRERVRNAKKVGIGGFSTAKIETNGENGEHRKTEQGTSMSIAAESISFTVPLRISISIGKVHGGASNGALKVESEVESDLSHALTQDITL